MINVFAFQKGQPMAVLQPASPARAAEATPMLTPLPLGPTMPAEDAARKILALLRARGGNVGDSFAVDLAGRDPRNTKLAVQKGFLAGGRSVDDFKAGLELAVEKNWLSLGRAFGVFGESQTYLLQPAGFEIQKKD